MSGKTFYGNLYRQALARFKGKQRATAQLLEDAAKTGHGLGVSGLCSSLKKRRKEVLALPPPPREWTSVIGITTRAYVSEERNGAATKHGGHYMCRVRRADNEAGYIAEMTGPKGTIEWWEGCGMSGRAVFKAIGGWNHHPRMFFGLEARKGKPRRSRGPRLAG